MYLNPENILARQAKKMKRERAEAKRLEEVNDIFKHYEDQAGPESHSEFMDNWVRRMKAKKARNPSS